MDDLLKDAIADAKAVRETALANAKLALEEAFTPRIQSMLSNKIQSEIEGEEDAEEMAHEEGEDHDEEEEVPAEAPAPEAPAEEEPVVAAEPEEGEEVADEGDYADEEEEAEVAPDADEMSHEGEDHDEEEGEDDVIEINGVKYAPVVSEEEDEDEAMHEEEDEEEGDDLDLESILRELEDEDEGEEVEEAYDEGDVGDGLASDEVETADEAELAENDVSSDIGAADNKLKPEAGDSSKVGQGPEGEGSDSEAGKEDDNLEVVDDLQEDIDLEEVLKALTEEEDEDEMKKEEEEKEKEVEEQVKTLSSDLEEHRNVVKYLRGKLNEVNLLNAKLLFTNKLFRNFGLNNEQKLKVVETFDRATNLREVKLVFSTLAESFGNKVASKPSKPIKESKGSSSKPVASTKPKKKEVISEGDEMKQRFQKLANIL